MKSTDLSLFLAIVVGVGCGGRIISEDIPDSGTGLGGNGGTVAKGGAGGTGGVGGKGGTGGWHTDGAGAFGGWGGAGTAGTGGWHGDGAGAYGGWGGAGTAGTGGWHGDGAGAYGGWGGGDGAGAYGGTGGAAGASQIGKKCKSDQQCPGLICIPPTSLEFFGGGPANGYCSYDCTSFLQGIQPVDPCPKLSPNSMCVAASPDSTSPTTRGFCLEGCEKGPPLDEGDFGKFDANKCHGRHDVACSESSSYASICLPTCARDADCPSGRYCDPRNTVCVDTPTPGSPLGAHCDPANVNECSGLCLQIQKDEQHPPSDPLNIASFCSQTCVYGDLKSCGFTQTPPAGVCLFATTDSGNGDTALCAPLCDVDSDCLDQVDNAYCDTEWVQYIGRGLCLYNYGTNP